MNVYLSYEINLKGLEESNIEELIDAVQLLKMFSCLHSKNICVNVLITTVMNF